MSSEIEQKSLRIKLEEAGFVILHDTLFMGYAARPLRPESIELLDQTQRLSWPELGEVVSELYFDALAEIDEDAANRRDYQLILGGH